MVDPGSVATNPVLDFLSKWSPLWLLLLGGLLAQLWNRFRTRMRRFTWRAWHNPVAIAGNDPFWGNVTVQYNGVPVNHVHVTTIELTNDSSEDQKDVVVTLSFQDGIGHIIGSVGVIQGCVGGIPFDADYLKLFQGATPQQVQALTTYVEHKIPVFNRRQKAMFTLLVVRDDASAPVIQVSCNHPGVKLEYLPAGAEVNGVPFNLALGVGFLITPAVIFLLVRYQLHSHPYLSSLVGWFLGLYITKVGAGAVRVWKNIVRVLG
jgi:hypothetical protein